jgi:hypothetical protein
MTKTFARTASAAAVMLMGSLSAAPAMAGPAEMALLESYVGEWRGEGVTRGTDRPESFRCRLTINKGNQARINYAGRCTLANMNLSVSGTILYNDSARRYEAAMSSNAGFTGLAVGRQQGGRISFDLAERQTDRGGNDVRIGSAISLSGGTITVDFEVEFNNSGQKMTAAVPFAR